MGDHLAASNDADIAAIVNLVGSYVTAMTAGDRAGLESLFFENASEVGHFQGELLWNTREAFIGMCEEAGSDSTDPAWTIRSLSVHGDIAVVHVQNDWAGLPFDDILTLLFDQGAWRIVSKVYRVRP
jgi:hypothetical protein